MQKTPINLWDRVIPADQAKYSFISAVAPSEFEQELADMKWAQIKAKNPQLFNGELLRFEKINSDPDSLDIAVSEDFDFRMYSATRQDPDPRTNYATTTVSVPETADGYLLLGIRKTNTFDTMGSGYSDPLDLSPLATAVREASEEIQMPKDAVEKDKSKLMQFSLLPDTKTATSFIYLPLSATSKEVDFDPSEHIGIIKISNNLDDLASANANGIILSAKDKSPIKVHRAFNHGINAYVKARLDGQIRPAYLN